MLGRRELVKGAAGMFGLGKPDPSKFPYAGRPQPSPGIGPSQGTQVRARTVIVFGAGGGVFVYSGTPGPGNLIASLTNAATDPFGNPTKPQSAVYGTDGTYVQMQAGAPASLFIGSGDSAEATAARLLTQVSGAGVTRRIVTTLRAPRVSGESVSAACSILLFSESADLTLPAFLSMVVTDDAGVNTSAYNQTPNGFAFGNQPVTSTGGTPANPTLVTTDTWHDMSGDLLNGWTVTGGQRARYMLMPDDSVWIQADLTTGTLAGGTNVWTVPGAGAYTPATGQEIPCFIIASTAAAQPQDPYFTIAASGAHGQCHNFVANQTRIGIDHKYALG
jgi:hypothetical protein